VLDVPAITGRAFEHEDPVTRGTNGDGLARQLDVAEQFEAVAIGHAVEHEPAVARAGHGQESAAVGEGNTLGALVAGGRVSDLADRVPAHAQHLGPGGLPPDGEGPDARHRRDHQTDQPRDGDASARGAVWPRRAVLLSQRHLRLGARRDPREVLAMAGEQEHEQGKDGNAHGHLLPRPGFRDPGEVDDRQRHRSEQRGERDVAPDRERDDEATRGRRDRHGVERDHGPDARGHPLPPLKPR